MEGKLVSSWIRGECNDIAGFTCKFLRKRSVARSPPWSSPVSSISHFLKLTKRFADHNLPGWDMFRGNLDTGEDFTDVSQCFSYCCHLFPLFCSITAAYWRIARFLFQLIPFSFSHSLPTTCTSPPNWLLSRNNLGFHSVPEFCEALEWIFVRTLRCGRARIDFFHPLDSSAPLRPFAHFKEERSRKLLRLTKKLSHLPFPCLVRNFFPVLSFSPHLIEFIKFHPQSIYRLGCCCAFGRSEGRRRKTK